MKQISSISFVSEDGKMTFVFDSDTPAGSIHDFLMEAKGIIVDRMMQAHAEEHATSEKFKSIKTED